MKILATNKKININYEIVDSYECGIELKGNEVKSIYNSQCSIDEAFGFVSNGQMFLINMYVSPWEKANTFFKINPVRKRKLLLHKNEIVRIEAEQKKKKYALIAHQVYLKNNKIKVELSLARSKNHRDKRNDIKNKENDRYAKKVIKNFK